MSPHPGRRRSPAGFGKSTLVSEWFASSSQPAAWLSLDDGDSDPARFLSYLVAALRSVAANIGEGVSAVLQGDGDCRPTARQRMLSRCNAVDVAHDGEPHSREEDRYLPGIEGPRSKSCKPRGEESESQVAEGIPHPRA